MAYNNNIPQANDLISQSQSQILENFRQLDLQYGTQAASDHVAFSAVANNGTHKKVTFSSVAADPAETFPESQLYTKNSGVTPNQTTDLFFSYKPETGADVVRQLTFSGISPTTGSGQLSNGLQIRAGSGTANTIAVVNTFSTPFTTACIAVVVTVTSTNNVVRTALINNVNFSAITTGITSFQYIAIGY